MDNLKYNLYYLHIWVQLLSIQAQLGGTQSLKYSSPTTATLVRGTSAIIPSWIS